MNNFVFRRNKSYNNHYTIGADERHAQGFMLDPGSPNSRFPQVPSHDNLLEDNQAWGNDGYGLRVVGSTSNTIQRNSFTGGLQGITLEQGSTGNIVQDNTITGSQIYGIYLIGGSDSNTIQRQYDHAAAASTASTSRPARTRSATTCVTNNGTIVNGVPSGSGIASYADGDPAAALADLRLPGSSVSIAAADPDLLNAQAQASAVADNLISGNSVLEQCRRRYRAEERQRHACQVEQHIPTTARTACTWPRAPAAA